MVGARWFFDADDANIDECSLFGCSLIHGGDFQLDNSNVEVRSTLFNDCTSATQSGSTFERNIIVNANTADGVAFIITDDISDIKNCDFTFSDGHAIEYAPVGAGPFVRAVTGNTFSATYGADDTNDAGVLVNPTTSSADIELNIGGGGNTFTTREVVGYTGTLTVANPKTLTFNVSFNNAPDPADYEWRLYEKSATVGTIGNG